ncbi:hypothetical protein RRG08_025838 [Elysia crispata]|uniref:Uncharacterized protein n=1 Tax=Elysia crispata TaxID=231223 RepID=A0AAE0Y3J8_9GAST|nr:hypothetical protein RRG08_025838 [Elysia crispata]
MKLYLGVVHTSMLYRWTWGLHVRHDETLPGCCAHIHAVQVDMGPARGHGACTSDMMKLYLGVVRSSMLYRWTCGLHVRHDETLPGCCALIHAVQVVPIDEADVDGVLEYSLLAVAAMIQQTNALRKDVLSLRSRISAFLLFAKICQLHFHLQML